MSFWSLLILKIMLRVKDSIWDQQKKSFPVGALPLLWYFPSVWQTAYQCFQTSFRFSVSRILSYSQIPLKTLQVCVDNNTDFLTFATSQADTAKTVKVWFLIFKSFHHLSPSLSPRDLQNFTVYSGNAKSLKQ